MQIVIEVNEDMLKSVAENAVKAAFREGDRWESSGAGTIAIRKQANAWAESQDYSGIIAKVAQGALDEAVRQAVIEAIRADVKRTVKAMRESGELSKILETP